MRKKQISCVNGHYYSDEYKSCPICRPSTVLVGIGDNSKKNDARQIDGETSASNSTVYIQSTKRESEEENEEVILAGWLVIISDKGKGKHFSITFGFNSIGRNPSNSIVITNDDASISREKHASIIYDYSNNIYFIKHEDGKFLTYLNNNLILETKELSAFDKIKIGNTELLFVPLCGENFQWNV